MAVNRYGLEIDSRDSTMRLAHPLRVAAAEPDYLQAVGKLLGSKSWGLLKAQFADQTKGTSRIIADVIDVPGFEPLKGIARASSQLPGGTEVGNFYSTLLAVRHDVAPQPYFRIEDSLCELLLHTDLDDDLPLEVLRVPYPRFYVEFGQKRDLPLVVPNDLSGDHILEGAYVEYDSTDPKRKGLYVMFTGSPLGKSDALDDATAALFLPLGEALDLKTALRRSFEAGVEAAHAHDMFVPSEDSFAPSLVCLNFLAKVLLYLSLPEARRSIHPDKTAWLKSTAGLKSTAKVVKAERRARQLTDYILISAPTGAALSEPTGGEPGTSLRPHWRRGHYRMQAYGAAHTLRKLVFIRPTLVNADKSPITLATPEYRVV